MTFGGDHSVTIPAVRAVREKIADPGLVLIDMHLDTAPDVGGEERHVFNLANTLAGRGHEVTVATQRMAEVLRGS